jgi:hypothetical protein
LSYGQKAEGAIFVFKERNEIRGKIGNFGEWCKEEALVGENCRGKISPK